MSFQAFDVVVVPFPYSDRMAEKRRPALVVSAPGMQAVGRLWVVMITSVAADQPGDSAIADLEAAGLDVGSTIRASKIATIEADRVMRRIGHLSGEDEQGAIAALRLCAGFCG